MKKQQLNLILNANLNMVERIAKNTKPWLEQLEEDYPILCPTCVEHHLALSELSYYTDYKNTEGFWDFNFSIDRRLSDDLIHLMIQELDNELLCRDDGDPMIPNLSYSIRHANETTNIHIIKAWSI